MYPMRLPIRASGMSEGAVLMKQISQSKKIWRRFCRNKLAVLGLIMLILFVLLSVLAPLLTDYDPNRSNLRNRNLPPLWGTPSWHR